MEKKTCKTCKYYMGDSQCYGQKNAPRVAANDCCEGWRARTSYTKAQYKRAFEIACDLLNGDNLYGIAADNIFGLIMQEHGVVSAFRYKKFILEHLDRFDDNDEVRHNAIERLGW